MLFDVVNSGKLKKELEKYDGLIPLSLSVYYDYVQYLDYLKKNKSYNKVHDLMINRRESIKYLSVDEQLQFEDDELKSWLKDNSLFREFIWLEENK